MIAGHETDALKRRRLNHLNFDEVLADVERLRQEGYERVGEWELGQIADHLAGTIHGSIHGFPFQMPWVFRRFYGPSAFKKILEVRRLKSGVKLPPSARPPRDAPLAPAVERLASAIREFEAHDGHLQEHPMLGKLSKEDWRQFHLIHCSHHLGFLVPRNEIASEDIHGTTKAFVSDAG